MAKQIKAYINAVGPGEYDYLTTIAFEHPQSDCLRITRISLRKPNETKAFKLPNNLLSWFTEHAAAGREISRDDNNQQNHASLYVERSALKKQLEAFSLGDELTLEILINELDRDEEALARKDNGQFTIMVQLYEGPRAGCELTVSGNEPAGKPTHHYPTGIGRDGCMALGEVTLKSTEGPLDPLFDKRVLLADITPQPPYEGLRPALLARLCLLRNERLKPSQYVRDRHTYDELYPKHPIDQKAPFPDGSRIFGPLLPKAPREKPAPYTIALKAPLSDPFWQVFQDLYRQSKCAPLKARLSMSLPEPEKNQTKAIDITLAMDPAPALIITDANTLCTPAILPLEEKVKQPLTLTLERPFEGEITPQLITMLYHKGDAHAESENDGGDNAEGEPNGGGEAEPAAGLMNLGLAAEGETTSHQFKPDVLEMAPGQRQLILLNPTPEGQKNPPKTAAFKISCLWPEQQRQQEASLTINWTKPLNARAYAIDIGTKAIAMAKKDQMEVKPLDLASKAPAHYLIKECLPATLTLSNGTNMQEEGAADINDRNWRAATFPLSLSFKFARSKTNALQQRLAKSRNHYDICLPAQADQGPAIPLKPLITTGTPEQNPPAPMKLSAPNNETFFITRQKQKPNGASHNLALTREVKGTPLLEDCLHELMSFYGTYLPAISRPELLTVEQKNTAASIPDRPTSLILTHADYLTNTAITRYSNAAAAALGRYNQGCFNHLGIQGELLGLESETTSKSTVHLVSEITAGAYQGLLKLAEREQPARAQKITQIHLDIGTRTISLGAFTGWVGETEARLERQTGAINLPLGGKTLQRMLVREVAKIIDRAVGEGAPLTPLAPLPETQKQFNACLTPSNEEETMQARFITALQSAIHTTGEGEKGTGANTGETDFVVTLAKSTGDNWPFSLSTSIEATPAAKTIWQGLNGEKITLRANEQKTEWQLQLQCSLGAMCEKVGPLSTYLAFITALLPRAIAATLPPRASGHQLVVTLSGGPGLFPPLQASLRETARHLSASASLLPESYSEAKLAIATGAAQMIHQQKTPPHSMILPNILVRPLMGGEDQGPGANQGGDIVAISQSGALATITRHQQAGTLPPGTETLEVIETISGLASLLENDSNALSCRHYMDDLDRASDREWAIAADLWADWLQHCTQTMLNMAVPGDQQAGGREAGWGYQTLQENEARFTINDHTYWISSGLTMAETGG